VEGPEELTVTGPALGLIGPASLVTLSAFDTDIWGKEGIRRLYQ